MGLTALKVEDLPHYTYDGYARWEGWLYRVQAKRRLGKDKKGVQYGKRK